MNAKIRKVKREDGRIFWTVDEVGGSGKVWVSEFLADAMHGIGKSDFASKFQECFVPSED
jgi:hypothetical protein